MAYFGPWGCFIHIPKTGGSYINKVLVQKGTGHQDGVGHTLPKEVDYAFRYFACVRHPAYWLRSIWRNRNGERFLPYPHPEPPWADFCTWTNPYQSNDLYEFVRNITSNLPGILTWLHNLYTPPPVEVIRLEDISEWLVNQGYNPNVKIPNKATDLPPMTDEIFNSVYKAEKSLYTKYGYTRKRINMKMET